MIAGSLGRKVAGLQGFADLYLCEGANAGRCESYAACKPRQDCNPADRNLMNDIVNPVVNRGNDCRIARSQCRKI
ncbi:MAG: hypothetical protein AMS27_04345 [Bacteroides sp. SM23_62_1]|nr:MAG: hypothetical protein AMS27_04345 [Bacteroides sp. SM23_62_1]